MIITCVIKFRYRLMINNTWSICKRVCDPSVNYTVAYEASIGGGGGGGSGRESKMKNRVNGTPPGTMS
jgi:hypothetical protein